MVLHEQLQSALTRDPFIPFRVVMAGGETYDVRGPEHVMLVPAALHVGVGAAEGSLIHDRLVRCPLKDIDRLETIDFATPTAP